MVESEKERKIKKEKWKSNADTLLFLKQYSVFSVLIGLIPNSYVFQCVSTNMFAFISSSSFDHHFSPFGNSLDMPCSCMPLWLHLCG